MKRRFIMAGLCAAAMAAAGCNASNDSAGPTVDRPDTRATVAPEPAGPEEPAAPDDSGQPTPVRPVETTEPVSYPPTPDPSDSGDTSCLTADSGVVHDAVNALAPPNGRDSWAIETVGHKPFPGCQELQWVQVGTPGGTASSGYHVLFFHDNRFVGTANTFPTAYTQVVGDTDDSVAIQYRWLDDDDSSCCPEGGPVVITYTWDGSGVGQDQPLPDDLVSQYTR